MEGNLPFLPFLLCIWGQLPSTSPAGAYTRRGDLPEGFLRYWFVGLIYLEGLYIYGSCIALHCKSEKSIFLHENPFK